MYNVFTSNRDYSLRVFDIPDEEFNKLWNKLKPFSNEFVKEYLKETFKDKFAEFYIGYETVGLWWSKIKYIHTVNFQKYEQLFNMFDSLDEDSLQNVNITYTTDRNKLKEIEENSTDSIEKNKTDSITNLIDVDNKTLGTNSNTVNNNNDIKGSNLPLEVGVIDNEYTQHTKTTDTGSETQSLNTTVSQSGNTSSTGTTEENNTNSKDIKATQDETITGTTIEKGFRNVSKVEMMSKYLANMQSPMEEYLNLFKPTFIKLY